MTNITTKRTFIIGSTSAIAMHVSRYLVSRNSGALYLTSRDSTQLEVIAADLRVRGAVQVETESFDAANTASGEGIIKRASDALGGLDAVIFSAGVLPDQDSVNSDATLFRNAMEVNATSAMVILNQAATFFEHQKRGQIVAIGSVAGDRGRAVNYAYGVAKGALEVFMSGLRQRLHGKGVQVLLVKPGFVDTPMTTKFEKGPLWASPEQVARDIVNAMERGRSVIYTPWFWRWIMLIIKIIPESIFQRLKF